MALDEPELDHDGFALAEDLVQSPTHKAASTTTVDFDGLLDPGLLLHEDLAKGNRGQAWPAGVILTKYLLRRKREELRTASMLISPCCFKKNAAYHELVTNERSSEWKSVPEVGYAGIARDQFSIPCSF